MKWWRKGGSKNSKQQESVFVPEMDVYSCAYFCVCIVSPPLHARFHGSILLLYLARQSTQNTPICTYTLTHQTRRCKNGLNILAQLLIFIPVSFSVATESVDLLFSFDISFRLPFLLFSIFGDFVEGHPHDVRHVCGVHKPRWQNNLLLQIEQPKASDPKNNKPLLYTSPNFFPSLGGRDQCSLKPVQSFVGA